MSMRSQTIAIAVLLVALGIIFLLVGNAGVSTGVFLPEPTLTPIPPTATPLPDPAADHWSESAPGQVAYTADAERSAQIAYQTMPLDTFIEQRQLDAPAEDAALPLLDLLQQRADLYVAQIEELQLKVEPDAVEPPVVEKFGGVPVAMLRIKVPSQALPDGRDFPGLDLVEGLVENGEDDVTFLEYSLGDDPDPIVYNDFRAWLEANAPRLAGQEEDEPAAEEAATEEPPDEDAAAEPEATEEAVEPADEEATAEPSPEADQEATEESAEPADEPTAEEATGEPTPEPDLETTEEAAAPADAEVAAAPEQEATTERGWTEVGEGQYVHTTTTNAYVGYYPSTTAEMSGQLGIEAPADDAEEPLLDMVIAAKNDLEFQVTELGVSFAEGSVEGPEMREYDSIPVAYFHATIDPFTAAQDQTYPGQEMALGIIDQGDGNIQLVQMQYIFEADPDPGIYADFLTWLEDNAAMLAVRAESDDAAPQPEATAEPES